MAECALPVKLSYSLKVRLWNPGETLKTPGATP
jgi:hypothetical protein